MASNEVEIIARGVWWHKDLLLVCRNVKHGYCFLPGGHVEFGESAAEALAREFDEEAGVRVRVGELQAVAELRFVQNDRERHEISLVFHVEHLQGRTEDPPVVESRESKIEFAWIARGDLGSIDFRPRLIAEWLMNPVATGCAWLSGDDRPSDRQ